MLLSSTHHLVLSQSCSFRAYPFNRSVVSSFQVIPILSSFASLFYRSAVCILSFSFLAYSVSTGVVTCPSLSLELFIHGFATPKFSQCSLFLFSNGVFSTSFIFVVFFSRNCLTSQGYLVSLVCTRRNFVLPLPLPLLAGAILDLGTRSLVSGGVL